jgi:hypothetical protein
MKIFLNSAMPKYLVEARKWLPRIPSLPAIEDWLIRAEAELGECHVFVEGALRAPHRQIRVSPNGQIDLFLAFKCCALAIEIKQHPRSDSIPYEKLIKQIDGQRQWIEALLREANLREGTVGKVAFFPNLDAVGLEATERRLRGAGRTDIPIVGSLTFGPYGWDQRFADRLTRSLMEPTADLRTFFHRCFDQGLGYLKQFPSFSKANGFLATVSDLAEVSQSEGYVPGLRESETRVAIQILNEYTILILSGPEGIGKSVVAREVINELELPVHTVSNAASSLQKLVVQLAEAADGLPHHGDSWEPLLESLMDQPSTFWIQQTNEASARAIGDLYQRINRRRAIEPAPSRWILESCSTLSGVAQSTCRLQPLENRALAAILERVPSGSDGNAFETAITKSGGNPRDALALWQSGGEYDITAGHKANLAWLSGSKRKLAAGMAAALLRSPLGMRTGILRKWAALVLPSRTASELDEAFRELLDLFAWNGLAERVQFPSDLFEGQLDDVIDPSISLDLIVVCSDYQLQLLAQELGDGTPLAHLSEKWLNLLIEESAASPLLRVTASLLSGEVDEFYLSPFRWSSVTPIIAWLESEPAIEWSSQGSFLLKVLRLSGKRCMPAATQLDIELGPKPTGFRACDVGHSILTWRCSLPYQANEPFDFANWYNEVNAIPDAVVRSEILSRAADWLGDAAGDSGAVEAWGILQSLLEDKTLAGDDRVFVMLKALEFLNRQKIVGKALSEDDAANWRSQLARELIAFAMRTEDLQLLCHAFFYPARASEFAEARKMPRAVGAWEAVLVFAEKFTDSRRLRIRALLSLSSIHRHMLREQDVPWSDFVMHATPAIDYARRALRYSRATGSTMHQLNALSYMSQVCIMAFKVANVPECRDWFCVSGKEVWGIVGSELPKLAADAKGDREREIYENTRLNLAHVAFAVLAARGGTPNCAEIARLREHFEDVVQTLRITTDAGVDPVHRPEVRKFVTKELSRLRRLVAFANSPSVSIPGFLSEIKPELLAALRVTRRAFGKAASNPTTPWAKLCVALNEDPFRFR